jgi:DNA-binding IclR family transcriptional regulator
VNTVTAMRTTGIQVLDRALSILEVLAQSSAPLGRNALAERLDLHPTTCSRILRSLANAGYVEQTEPKGGYVLGVMPHALVAGQPYRKDLVARAAPILEEWADTVGETVLLAVLRQGRRTVLQEFEGSDHVQVRKGFAQRWNPFETATGRLLVAYAGEAERAVVFRRYPLGTSECSEWLTPEDVALWSRGVRHEGQVIRSTESGVVGVAYPVCEDGRVTASIGTHMPAYRFEGRHAEVVQVALREAAEKIGSAPPPRERMVSHSARGQEVNLSQGE